MTPSQMQYTISDHPFPPHIQFMKALNAGIRICRCIPQGFFSVMKC